MPFTPEQLKEMALQLSHPQGAYGITIADMMHDSNFGMTKSTIDGLQLVAGDKVLELGHGNGKHISEILNRAKDISYQGLEISELMKKEAETQNLTHASFTLYDGKIIPFENEQFTKIMTVNTIYFWEKPIELLNEIYRVLQPNGICCIGFAQKEFMEMLPFTQHGFNLYNDTKFEQLANKTSFKLLGLNEHQEKIRSKANELVDRAYTVARLQKLLS